MIQELNNSNWKVIKEAGKIKVIDFYASWCGPCKTLGPILEDLEKEYSNSVEFFKADVEECYDASDEFRVMSVPTVFILKDGEVVDKIVGLGSKDKIKSTIDGAI